MDINELKQQLQERANLDPDQAEKAAQVALEFISEQAPQVSGFIQQAGGAEELANRLGNFFQKRN